MFLLFIHIYIYTYIHIYIFTYIHIYIFTYLHIYIYTYTYLHIYIFTYIHIYIYTYMHMRIYIFTYLHIYIYTYIHIYIYSYIHIYIYTYIHIHIYIHIFICIIVYTLSELILGRRYVWSHHFHYDLGCSAMIINNEGISVDEWSSPTNPDARKRLCWVSETIFPGLPCLIVFGHEVTHLITLSSYRCISNRNYAQVIIWLSFPAESISNDRFWSNFSFLFWILFVALFVS